MPEPSFKTHRAMAVGTQGSPQSYVASVTLAYVARLISKGRIIILPDANGAETSQVANLAHRIARRQWQPLPIHLNVPDGSVDHSGTTGPIAVTGELHAVSAQLPLLAIAEAARNGRSGLDLHVPVFIHTVTPRQQRRLSADIREAAGAAGSAPAPRPARAPEVHNALVTALIDLQKEAQPSAFHENVSLTSRIPRDSAHAVAVSTLVAAARQAYPKIDRDDVPNIVADLHRFFSTLTDFIPELASLPLEHRQRVRNETLLDHPVMYRAYFLLARHTAGMTDRELRTALGRIARAAIALDEPLFNRRNQIWQTIGVAETTDRGNVRIINSNDAAQQAASHLANLANIRTTTA